MTALGADPAQSAAALFPKQAAANRAIFHHPGGQARSRTGVRRYSARAQRASGGNDSDAAIVDV